jgi:hypothetical protein
LSEYWYRQNTKQRADEQVSHGRSKTDERVKPLDGRLLERHSTTGRDHLISEPHVPTGLDLVRRPTLAIFIHTFTREDLEDYIRASQGIPGDVGGGPLRPAQRVAGLYAELVHPHQAIGNRGPERGSPSVLVGNVRGAHRERAKRNHGRIADGILTSCLAKIRNVAADAPIESTRPARA